MKRDTRPGVPTLLRARRGRAALFRLARASAPPHARVPTLLRSCDRRRPMPLDRIAAAACLWLLAFPATARACDSYADDMALASVLARAVSEARAQGLLAPRVTTAATDIARGLGERQPEPMSPRAAEEPTAHPEVSFLP